MKTSTSHKTIKVILSLFLAFFLSFTADRVLASDYDHYNPIEKDASSTGFETLQHLNKEVCGWISLDGTKVDYPLLQSQDNVKYLDRNAFGDYTVSGSIFLDYRFNPPPTLPTLTPSSMVTLWPLVLCLGDTKFADQDFF